MKVSLDELKKKKAVLSIEDIDLYLLNSIRRIMLSELPKLAIEDVVIYDNTTTLFDEIISHRLGLVPLPTDPELLNFRDECSCGGKGCPSCTVRYTLSKEGEGTVYSGDLQPSEASWRIEEDLIPVVELFNDQRLILEVEAVLGQAKDHAKWQVVTAPGYWLYPSIQFDPEKKKDVEDFVEELPEGIVKSITKDSIELTDISKLPIFESYIDLENIDYITVDKDQRHIRFHFETDGSYTADKALMKSIEIFEEKLHDFTELIDDI
jgi:DNA-directed RNA polymerase subunit D